MTWTGWICRKLWEISIHTSAREVTRSLETRTGRTNFNPHFRKGSDLYFEYVIVIMQISIHTSAREVTVFTERSVTDEIDFNPHFRKGSDSPAAVFAVFTGYFNPHFRKGSDGDLSGYAAELREFQSTLPQGK